MIRLSRSRVWLLGICAAVVACLSTGAMAQPKLAVRASAASVDRVEQFIKGFGVELPPQISVEGLEKTMPFIGEGGVAKDRPIGVLLFASDELNEQQMVVIAIPVKEGAASVQSLRNAGAQLVEGKDDTLTMQNIGLRRTGGYLWLGGTPELLGMASEKMLTEPYGEAGTLVSAEVDVRALREGMPNRFKAVIEQGMKDAAEPAQKLGAQLGRDLMMRDLDRLGMSIHSDAQWLRVRMAIDPVKVQEAANLPRPALPAGAARLDLVYPSIETPRLIVDFFGKAAKAEAGDDKEFAAVFPLVMRLFDAALVADSVSASVAPVEGAPVYFQVNQYRGQKEFAADVDKVVGQLKAMIKEQNEPDPIKTSTYNVAGVEVHRFEVAAEGDKTIACVDVAQKGNAGCFTISTGTGKYIESLLAQPAGAQMGVGFDATVDFAAAVELVKALPLPDKPAAEKLDKLAQLVRGEKLTITAKPQGKGMVIEASVSQSLLKKLPQIGETLE